MDNAQNARMLRGDSGAKKPTKLVFFDIDGTLSQKGKFNNRFAVSAKEVLGIDVPLETVDAAMKGGRIDRGISVYLAKLAGVPEERMNETVDSLFASQKRYFMAHLDDYKDRKPHVGVVELLTALSCRDDMAIGVITGNLEEIARIKLKNIGLEGFFSKDDLGRFGDSSEYKAGLLEAAISHAEQKFGVKFDRANVFYVGDQVSDVEAGKKAGIATIAIATGKATLAELEKAGADHALQNMTDTVAVIGAIDGVRTVTKSKSRST